MVDRRDGFTLLEVMVSVAILATAFVSVLKLHSDSLNMLITARKHSICYQLAQYKMTEVENEGINNITFRSGTFESMPNYTWTLDIESTSIPGWVKVSVIVKDIHEMDQKGFVLTEYMSEGAIPNVRGLKE